MFVCNRGDTILRQRRAPHWFKSVQSRELGQSPISCTGRARHYEPKPTMPSPSHTPIWKWQLKTVSKWMSLYKRPLYDLSGLFFCHMYVHLSQNWGSDGHFEVLNRSYLWLVHNLWHKMLIFPFLFFLPFFTKTDVCIFCFFCGFVFFVITFVPIKI